MSTTKPVTIHLPAALSELAGRREISVVAATVLEALRSLDTCRPGLFDRVCTEQNEPRKHVMVYVDETEVRLLGGLKTPLSGGEKIVVVPAVSGG